jgi:hypothetical protein
MQDKDAINPLYKGGTAIIEYENMLIPSIVIDNGKFTEIRSIKSSIVNSILEILNDNGNVYVNIILEFSNAQLDVIINANENLNFFKALAEYGIIAIMPEDYESTTDIFMIQLAKNEKIENLYTIIKSYIV